MGAPVSDASVAPVLQAAEAEPTSLTADAQPGDATTQNADNPTEIAAATTTKTGRPAASGKNKDDVGFAGLKKGFLSSATTEESPPCDARDFTEPTPVSPTSRGGESCSLYSYCVAGNQHSKEGLGCCMSVLRYERVKDIIPTCRATETEPRRALALASATLQGWL